MAEEVRLLSERARREARMEDAITRARARLEAEERSSWARRAEQAALAVSDASPLHRCSCARPMPAAAPTAAHGSCWFCTAAMPADLMLPGCCSAAQQ